MGITSRKGIIFLVHWNHQLLVAQPPERKKKRKKKDAAKVRRHVLCLLSSRRRCPSGVRRARRSVRARHARGALEAPSPAHARRGLQARPPPPAPCARADSGRPRRAAPRGLRRRRRPWAAAAASAAPPRRPRSRTSSRRSSGAAPTRTGWPRRTRRRGAPRARAAPRFRAASLSPDAVAFAPSPLSPLSATPNGLFAPAAAPPPAAAVQQARSVIRGAPRARGGACGLG